MNDITTNSMIVMPSVAVKIDTRTFLISETRAVWMNGMLSTFINEKTTNHTNKKPTDTCAAWTPMYLLAPFAAAVIRGKGYMPRRAAVSCNTYVRDIASHANATTRRATTIPPMQAPTYETEEQC